MRNFPLHKAGLFDQLTSAFIGKKGPSSLTNLRFALKGGKQDVTYCSSSSRGSNTLELVAHLSIVSLIAIAGEHRSQLLLCATTRVHNI